MERSNKWIRGMGIGVNIFTVLVIAAAITGMAITPVMADGRGHGGGHGKHWKHYKHHRSYYVHPAPVVVAPAPYYAPPAVVYAPPPPPPPGISIVFPITIR